MDNIVIRKLGKGARYGSTDLHTWAFDKGAIALYGAMGMIPQRYVFEKKL